MDTMEELLHIQRSRFACRVHILICFPYIISIDNGDYNIPVHDVSPYGPGCLINIIRLMLYIMHKCY